MAAAAERVPFAGLTRGGSMAELDDGVHERIQAFCAEGDALATEANYPAALKKYWAAWDLLPEPRTDWEAATWILAAVGDANFLSGDYAAGRDNLCQRHALPRRSRKPLPPLAPWAVSVRAR